MRFIRWATAVLVAVVLPGAVATAATAPGFTGFQGPIIRQGFDKSGGFIVSTTLRFNSTERSTVALVVEGQDKDSAQLFISPVLDRTVHRDLTCPHYIKTNFRIAKARIAALRKRKGITISSSYSVSTSKAEVKNGHASTPLNLNAGAYAPVKVPACK